MASGGKKRRLGAFEIVKDLAAKGAQGKLFVGRVVEPSFPGLKIGQLVALKVMPVHSDDVERQFRRLKRRTDALAATKHPGIVRYYGCFSSVGGFSEDIHVVVMELLKGQTLEERLAGNSLGLDADEVLKIIRTCAAALSCAAEHGIVHRDIKPSNIFLCDDGGVKLIDFEIARQDGASRTTTESGALRGTVDYMAPDFHQDFRPEKGFRGDQCSDVFSLTVCLYEMLAGCRPYSAGGTLGEQSMMAYFQRWTRVPGVDVNRALKIEPYKIHALAHVQKVIKRGLSPERAGRYLTYFEFSDALRAVKLREIISPTGRYQLLRCVGKGGFGVVFRARRVDDGMIVAIKCLLRPEYSERFIREAKVLRKFHDDRLVSFVEYFKTVRGATETFFIVMQFLEGMPGFSLRDRINGVKAGGRIPPREIAEAFRRFAEGLQLLHEAGVIHRDIKPANLYMPPGHPEKSCVMDLGVAKTDETQTNGSLPGTLDYMPPEMATGTSRGDPAVDIYALGLCLYEALTCKTAYPRLKRGGDGLAEFYKRAKSGEKPDLSGLDGSPMWRKLVTKMTDPDVGRRVKTAKEVVRLIARIPDSELPDVREKDANAADRESTDNYVIPGSRGGALPAGETGESADSDSTEVHVDNATQEHESAESADGGTAVEEPAPPPSPARTNAEAEEKLSAAIAEVENIVAAQQVPQGDARDGTAADVGGQTLVLDATVAAQETTTAAQETTSAAATATAATKGFGGTAADLGGQTLVLDATAAAQETTTASVSATAATKALDGTAASIADRTIATAATSPEPPVRPSRIPLVSRDMGGPGAVPAAEPREPRSGAVATAESKAEPSVIISRPKRSRAPLVIAASLAICAVAGSLISVQKKADAEGKTIPQYIAEHHPGMWNLLPDFTARRVQKAEKTFGSDVARIVGRLNELRDEIGTSDKPDSYGDYLASAGEGIADAWARAEAKGVTNSATYAAVLANHGYAAITNGFLTAIINRRDELTREKEKAAAIKATEAGFREEAEKIMAPLRRLAEEIAKSKDPESFTNEIARADAELDAAWSKAKTAGVADSVLADCGFKTIANGLVDAIANRRKTLEDIAAAEARFREAADKIIAPLRGLEEEIVKSKDPESFTNEIVRTKTALDAAWSKAEKAGVADGVLADCGFKAIADGLVAAIDNRRNELARKENDAAAIAAAEASFRKEAETAIALLSGREQEIAGSKAPESFMGVMDKSTAALDAAWSKAKRAGVAYDVRDIVLSDCGYAEITNGFVAAIANRRAKLAIMDAVNEFADSSTNALASLQTLAEPNGEITTSDNPESFTNEIAAAWNALEAAWRKAEVAGVTNHAVYEAKLYSYATLSNQVATAIEKRRNELNAAVLANARGIFEKKADEALKLLRVLQGPTGAIVGSDNPDEYRVKIGEAREKLDTAWKTAMEAGVEDDVRKTKYTEFSICSNSVMTAISTRKEVLDGEYGQYVIKFDEHKKDAGKIRNAASHHEALTAIAKATKNLPSYGSSSPWKGKYDDLRKKYDALKASISAQTAKISVKNDGDVALAVTLGDKTATIEKGESHTFDKLAVWTDYKLSAAVSGRDVSTKRPARPEAAPPGSAGFQPAAADYTLVTSEKTESTKGTNTIVRVSFAAGYNGDPTLVVRNDNPVAIKINGKTINPGKTYATSGKPRTDYPLSYACDNADYEFTEKDREAIIRLGNAGTKNDIVAPTLVLKPDPKIVVTLKDGTIEDWTKKHPHVEWVVTLDSDRSGEHTIGEEFTVPAAAKHVKVSPRINKDFGKDYGSTEWFKYGQLGIEYVDQTYYISDIALKRRETTPLAFEPMENPKMLAENKRLLADYKKWLTPTAQKGLLEKERSIQPSYYENWVQALLMLKEVYGVDVVTDNLNRLGKIYDYESTWAKSANTHIADGWERLKGHLARLGVAKPQSR